jgi:hypothetical protein
MAKARKEIELSVHIGDVPGGLGKVLATVASCGINILAYCAYTDHNDLVVLLVSDNPLEAKLALERGGFQCKANSVVLVGATDQVGAAAKLGASLGSAGIDILYSYASSSGNDQFFAVFKTADDEQAIRVLDMHPWAQAA